MPKFDYVDLVNALVNNGQLQLPPPDTMRMGIVVGFDPNFDGSGSGGPLLSVQLAGDETPMHGITYSTAHCPKLEETVWVTVTGTDAFVTGSISGNTPGTTKTSATAKSTGSGQGASSHLLVHTTWQDSHKYTTPTCNTPTPVLPTSGKGEGLNVTCDVHPNTIYKVEVAATVHVTQFPTTNSFFTLGVFVPPDTLSEKPASKSLVFHPVHTIAIPSTGYYTVAGNITWEMDPGKTLKTGEWNKMFPNTAFQWFLGWETGDHAFPDVSVATWDVQFVPTNPFPKTAKSKKTIQRLGVYHEGPAN